MFHRPKAETDAVEDTEAEEGQQSTVQKPDTAETQRTVMQKNETEEKNMSKKEDSKETQAAPKSPDIPGPKASYKPQVPQSSSIPGSYSSGGYHAGVAGSQTDSSVSGQGRRLIIGQGITMSGEIEACDYLVVEGTVEAALKGASVLEISETGTFYGTVEIENATISGRFEGDIIASGRLTVTSTGSITGTIAYQELAIEAGATLDGKISPLGGQAASSKPKKSRSKSAGVPNDNANEDELPFDGDASAAAE